MQTAARNIHRAAKIRDAVVLLAHGQRTKRNMLVEKILVFVALTDALFRRKKDVFSAKNT